LELFGDKRGKEPEYFMTSSLFSRLLTEARALTDVGASEVNHALKPKPALFALLKVVGWKQLVEGFGVLCYKRASVEVPFGLSCLQVS
jgi:hypothetical protein